MSETFASKLDKNFVLKGFDTGKREISIDSRLIEDFFSNSDGLYGNQEQGEFDINVARRVDELYYIIENMLPDIERQVISLLYFHGKNQDTTGRVIGISQEMVYYYKKRALSRIKIHYFLRSIDIGDMESFFESHITKKQKVAMIEYFKDHDLRKIAKTIRKIEGKNRPIPYEAIGSRIKLGMKKLKWMVEAVEVENPVKVRAELYFKVFSILKKHNSLYHSQSKKHAPKNLKA